MTVGRLVAATLVLLVLSTAAGPGFAHSGAKPGDGPPRGIPIANLTHGQMAVIADYRSEILALADRHPVAADETFRRVRNYANIQFAWCAWNLMPGGIADEASPFNACMHAHLAAIRDLLLRMRAQPGAGDAAALADRVDRSMMLEGAALVLCQYSADGFDTARVVGPDWAALPGHTPTLLSLAAALALAVAAVLGLRRLGLRRLGRPDSHGRVTPR